MRSYLTDTHVLAMAFWGLAALALVAVVMSHCLIRLRENQPDHAAEEE